MLPKYVPGAILLIAFSYSCTQAKVVPYTLELYYFSKPLDGVPRENNVLGVNGQYPGPPLEAKVGDTLEVTVVNKIQDGQGATLHWHGIHQKGTLFEDGTNMVTQCPLAPEKSQVYRFNVTMPGTNWYHSHVNSQYTEGMFGPLIVHGTPEVHEYDGEVTIMVSDWYHRSAHDNEEWHLSPPSRGVPPYPDSGLMNGMGRYPCLYASLQDRPCNEQDQKRPVFRIQKDKTYRVRLINAAAVTAFNVSIDEHTLRTIEVDGVDVAQPVETDIIPIAAGQRYSFLIKCDENSNKNRFVIRADMRKESYMLIEGANINKYPEALMGDVSGIIECVDRDLSHLPHLVEYDSEKFTWGQIVPTKNRTSYNVIDDMDLRPNDGSSAPENVDVEFNVDITFHEDHENIRRGAFNYTPFVPPADKPIAMKLVDGDEIPVGVFPLEIKLGEVVQLVMNNSYMGPHPMHLHGHHFWVVGQGAWGDGPYDPSRHNLTVTGVKRDTVVVHEKSWAVIRFVADNPGAWIFHCHIDWHALSGMGLTFIEAADEFKKTTRVPAEAFKVCADEMN